MESQQAQSPPTRPLIAVLPPVVSGLAVVMVIVTVAGAVRILTLPNDGEAEIKGWVSVVVLLVGLMFATVVVTCATLLRRCDGRVAAEVVDALGPSDPTAVRSERDGGPPTAPPPAGEVPATDYVTDGGFTGLHRRDGDR